MKFAKYLQNEVVPEWRKAYLNYKQGKKYLKAIEKALDQPLTKQSEPKEETQALRVVAEPPATDSLPLSPPHPLTASLVVDDLENPLPSLQGLPGLARSNSASDLASSPARLDSPTGTTPILNRVSRQRFRSYDSIPALERVAARGDEVEIFQGGEQEEGIIPERGEGSNADHPSKRPMKLNPVGGHRLGQLGKPSPQIPKSILHKINTILPPDSGARARHITAANNSLDSVMDQLLYEEKAFFKFLDSQLEMIDDFYRERELEAETKLKVIKQQIYVANEWKRRNDERIAKLVTERGWYRTEWSKVKSGIDSLIRTDTTTHEDVTIIPGSTPSIFVNTQACASEHTGGVAPGTNSLVAPSAQPSSYPNNRDLNRNIASSSGLRHRDVRSPDQTLSREESVALTITDPATYQERLVLEDETSQLQHMNHKVARTRIKAALYEFYRSLEMLKNYKILNITGFVKILKKFDKTAGWKASKAFEASKLKPSYFMSSTVVNDLIKETEDLFVNEFEKGHRRRGMAKLRIPDVKNNTHHASVARTGLYLGLAVPLLSQGLQAAFSSEKQAEIPYWNSLLLVYGGLFITTLFACLFGINMYVWAKSRINYKFIFEFDPRDNMDYHEFFELPVFFMLVLCLAVYLDFASSWTNGVLTAYWPLVFMLLVLLIIFLPLPTLGWKSRKWFIESFSRLLISGFYRVEFRDFFLADELNSLSYSIEQFEFAICAYINQWNNLGQVCQTSHMWTTPFLTSLPPWLRLLQCLRRYRDTLEWFPHLLNAGKYTASLVNLFVYFSYRHYGGTPLKVAFIVMSFFTSCYTFLWDIYMDWGLFRFGKFGGAAYGRPFLRPELVYQKEWVYYLAIVLDFFGRFSWVVRLIPMNLHPMALPFILAMVEMLRRWMWNFFRLENEHLNNCGQFRAIKDIPLPFHIRVEGETSDEEDREHDDEFDEGEETQQDESLPQPPNDMEDMQTINEQGIVQAETDESSTTKATLKSRPSYASGLAVISSGASIRSTGAASAQGSVQSASRLSGQGAGKRKTLHHSKSIEGHEGEFGKERSTAFVEKAVAKAGITEGRREALLTGSTVLSNKFYERRDFDSKILDTAEDWIGWPSSRSRSESRSRGSPQTNGGVGGASAGREGAGGSRPSLVSRDTSKSNVIVRIKDKLFGNPDDSEEYDDEDGDETDNERRSWQP